MSSGLDCRFYEKAAGKWYYDLETHTRGEYETYGPFGTFRAAKDDLNRNHSNPGGYSIKALPGCKHDLARPIEHRAQGEFTHNCDRCGGHLDKRDDNERRKEAWDGILLRDTANLILSKLAEKGLSKAQEKALLTLGVPKESIDKTLGRAAFWWKGVQARLDWANTAKQVEAALRAKLTDKPLASVADAHPGTLVFKYRAPDYSRTDPSDIVVKNIRHDFAVQIDWFGADVVVRPM